MTATSHLSLEPDSDEEALENQLQTGSVSRLRGTPGIFWTTWRQALSVGFREPGCILSHVKEALSVGSRQRQCILNRWIKNIRKNCRGLRLNYRISLIRCRISEKWCLGWSRGVTARKSRTKGRTSNVTGKFRLTLSSRAYKMLHRRAINRILLI